MFPNITSEDPGEPLRKHAAGVTSLYPIIVDKFIANYLIGTCELKEPRRK